jgi:pyruvate dehydrogenase E2 component (dihydrolipoamide acetyltransferase)
MPFEIVMPRLGWNMEKGSLGGWLKQDGDRVEMGEIIFTVEGDKATQEIEALESGILRIPGDSPPPGLEVPVGTRLAYILQPGESLPTGFVSELARPEVVAQASSRPAGQADQLAPSGYRNRISPRARRVAGELRVDWTLLHGSGRSGRIVERDVRQAAEAARARLTTVPVAERISPLARRLAAELGVDVDRLATALPGRRIERADVEAAARAGITAIVAPPVPGVLAGQPPTAPERPAEVVVPITAVRRAIAERMAASAHTAAAVTLTTEADATELVRLRTQLQEDGREPIPSYTDLLAKLVAAALVEHPMLNARLDGDVIRQSAIANIGIAVAAERGLLAPVLRDVGSKSLRQIAQESAALIERARAGRLTADELSGGSFTITNLGMYEIDAFTPIINLPECAVLGVGRIVPKQVVVDAANERVAIRRMVFLSLTFDHRLVDGAPAARFLQRIKQYVERPHLWLVG